MKLHIIKCECGFELGLTGIQLSDFETGMMGTLLCPSKCGRMMLPSSSRKESTVSIRTVEKEGQDSGWNGLVDFTPYFEEGKNGQLFLKP